MKAARCRWREDRRRCRAMRTAAAGPASSETSTRSDRRSWSARRGWQANRLRLARRARVRDLQDVPALIVDAQLRRVLRSLSCGRGLFPSFAGNPLGRLLALENLGLLLLDFLLVLLNHRLGI